MHSNNIIMYHDVQFALLYRGSWIVQYEKYESYYLISDDDKKELEDVGAETGECIIFRTALINFLTSSYAYGSRVYFYSTGSSTLDNKLTYACF